MDRGEGTLYANNSKAVDSRYVIHEVVEQRHAYRLLQAHQASVPQDVLHK